MDSKMVAALSSSFMTSPSCIISTMFGYLSRLSMSCPKEMECAGWSEHMSNTFSAVGREILGRLCFHRGIL